MLRVIRITWTKYWKLKKEGLNKDQKNKKKHWQEKEQALRMLQKNSENKKFKKIGLTSLKIFEEAGNRGKRCRIVRTLARHEINLWGK